METSYASLEDGGKQEENYIPNLTNLAMENMSFSNSDALGGWHSLSGEDFTMAAIFSTSTGLPFSFQIDNHNTMDERQQFASGVCALGDILKRFGYNQEFLCGSNASFGGRADFYKQHGNYQIYDYYSAIKDGFIDEDYYVWWGFEDKYLYEIAKNQLIQLSNNKEPFNLTMLTVDTHHVRGFVCDLCEDKYNEQLANVLICADKQINDFIEWCKTQDFYNDTLIVIIGDHPRMDEFLVKEINRYDRTVYNSFINLNDSLIEKADNTGREFAGIDMYPTILSGLGFSIDGNRLGLGTNLFSERKTLMEEIGYEKIFSETSKYSEFYIETFK